MPKTPVPPTERDLRLLVLSAEYEGWLYRNNLWGAGCAEELILGDLSTEQRRWVTDFILRWEKAERL